ncbi:MAG TPA: hypothetical protein VFN29_10060 [Chiayiivirga sp.]|nr:hypothetical protein [Chiayiivirga sp.]
MPSQRTRSGALHCSFTCLVLALSISSVAHGQARDRVEYLGRFDADGDGRVSLREYQDYMSRGFRAMDRDGDGRLMPGELPRGVRGRGHTTLEAHLRALARTFDLLDVDNDGVLNAQELTAPPP